MYHYIEDKNFLRNMHRDCADVVNQLVQLINNEGLIKVKSHLVGSGAKNMITQNGKASVDLDYNLEVTDFLKMGSRDCKKIKEYVKSCFDDILCKNDWGYCNDSTSALTTELQQSEYGNKTEYKIDLAIVAKINGQWNRLIHWKTGIMNYDQFIWNQVQHSHGLEEKVEKLKEEPRLWHDVRDVYLEKKNMYLRRQDKDHPSFIVYIEAVNEVYNEHFKSNHYDIMDVLRLH